MTDAEGDETARPDEGISWAGIAGGLLGALPLAFLGIEAVFDPNVSDTAGLFAVISLVFVPAIWVSMRRSNVRRAVQRGTVVACLVLAFFGALVVGDVILPTILLPATTLLAIASGLVFQRS